MDIFQFDLGIRQSISQFPHYGIIMMLQAGVKAMPQGFTRTLDQLADCLAKA